METITTTNNNQVLSSINQSQNFEIREYNGMVITNGEWNDHNPQLIKFTKIDATFDEVIQILNENNFEIKIGQYMNGDKCVTFTKKEVVEDLIIDLSNQRKPASFNRITPAQLSFLQKLEDMEDIENELNYNFIKKVMTKKQASLIIHTAKKGGKVTIK